MSYLAIARKYRPATFGEIVGQDHVTRTLENAIASGRIHHAFLFCGARGVGKTTAARALAKGLNCGEGPTARPCGACTSCLEISSGSSPDLIEIDGASNNSVEDVRDLRDTVHYAPTRGRYKIYLIDEVHMLSKAAFNALLKTLEEPPPHVVFIFATTEPNKILDTILSRVQRFDFKRIPVPAVVERLREIAGSEGATLSDQALRMIARAGEGSMRDAQSLLDKVISFGTSADGGALSDEQVAETLGLIDRGLLIEALAGLVEGEPHRCLDVIARVYDYGHELSQFTGDLLELLRHATLLRLSEQARRHVDVSGDELERLEAVVADVPPEVLTRTFHALLEVHDQVSRAGRPRIVLEMAVARLATKRPVQPLGPLLARLEELERRLRGGGAPAPVRGMRGGAPSRGPAPGRGDGPSRGGSPPRTSGGGRAPDPAPRRTERAAPPQARPRQTRRAPEPPPMPEPPPEDDPAPYTGAIGPPPGDGDPPEQAWVRLRDRLKALGPPAARLAEGDFALRRGVVEITLPAGRPLAEGRRARAEPDVQQALHRFFPRARGIEVVPRPGTGTPRDVEAALRSEVLSDPACKRVIEALEAELETVTSLREDS